MQDPSFFRLVCEDGWEKVPNSKKNKEKEDKIFKIRKDQWFRLLRKNQNHRKIVYVNHFDLQNPFDSRKIGH